MGPKTIFVAAASIGVCLQMAGVARADDNVLVIEQSGQGNILQVDQRLAFGSRVGGLMIDGASLMTLTNSARQIATAGPGGNLADLTFNSGRGSALHLLQVNTGVARNTAVAMASVGGTGAVAQIGSGNRATLTVGGLVADRRLAQQLGVDVDGAVVQFGDDNTADLTTTAWSAGAIFQEGNGNAAAVDMRNASPGTSLVYRQIGVGLKALTPVQVITNTPGVVTVTQQAGLGLPGQSGATGPGTITTP